VHLSGGQQRRLLLARALIRRPDVLLLDEPTAGVDPEGQEQFCALLKELTREGLTILLVSHDLPLITAYADRIACLNVMLHWHGRACELHPEIVQSAYRCELTRYQLRQPTLVSSS
ncbi:MAG: ATP-binding cassette domain-containing protein, partial [Verrucomicrobiae bacterium]|nr:ATP-binding cassette domain-containing protein [Verrucomicrobiae bacterium]